MTDTIALLNLPRLHAPLRAALQEAFDDAMDTGRFIGGERVVEFETVLGRYVGASHAVGVSSGTDALVAALSALGAGPGDEVITTAYSFIATAGSIARVGAKPVFVDIDPVTFNLDTSRIDAAVTLRTVGIVPVHLFGHCADMTPILRIAETRGLWVLEDAAQSIGARYGSSQAGTLGDAGIFSFFPAKNLGGLGDGGAVVTSDPNLADAVRTLRQHGTLSREGSPVMGGNFRLDALQAAFLSIKLDYLDGWTAGRRRVAEAYVHRLSAVSGVELPEWALCGGGVFNQFVIRTPMRDALRTHLAARGIASAVYYPTPLHLAPCFRALGYREGALPQAERASREALALPADPLLTDDELDRICEAVEEAVSIGLEGE